MKIKVQREREYSSTLLCPHDLNFSCMKCGREGTFSLTYFRAMFGERLACVVSCMARDETLRFQMAPTIERVMDNMFTVEVIENTD